MCVYDEVCNTRPPVTAACVRIVPTERMRAPVSVTTWQSTPLTTLGESACWIGRCDSSTASPGSRSSSCVVAARVSTALCRSRPVRISPTATLAAGDDRSCGAVRWAGSACVRIIRSLSRRGTRCGR